MRTVHTFTVGYTNKSTGERGAEQFIVAVGSEVGRRDLKVHLYWHDNRYREGVTVWREVPPNTEQKYPRDFTEIDKAKARAREHCQSVEEGRKLEAQKHNQALSR